MFLDQATRGPSPECARRLQLQLPGGWQAEAGQAGERGEERLERGENIEDNYDEIALLCIHELSV